MCWPSFRQILRGTTTIDTVVSDQSNDAIPFIGPFSLVFQSLPVARAFPNTSVRLLVHDIAKRGIRLNILGALASLRKQKT